MQGQDYVKNPNFAILSVLGNLACFYRKLYVYPSYDKILELLLMQCDRAMKHRQLGRHLGAFQRDGWLVRTSRHKRVLSGELEMHSTMYFLTAKTINWMKKLGGIVWKTQGPDAKSLIDIAVTITAENPPGENKSTTNRAAKAPPNT